MLFWLMEWKPLFSGFSIKKMIKKRVIGTASVSLIITSLIFFVLAFLFKNQISQFTNIKAEYISLVIWILLLDALVIIPFAWLRANEKPMK